ncbi:MAG: hypothetical protein IT323_00350 [Anaerolineae bacterium]|nr:hypothetical protein [Anaerolineae bacterium]
MTTTWTITVDWDRNGNFSGPYDDVTAYVISADWTLGMGHPFQEAADNSVLKLVLNNADRRFSPENGSSPLYGKLVPFRPVRIQSNDGTTTRTHWVGWVETLQPGVGKYGPRQMSITASGPLQFYKATETKLALQENKRTDAILAELIKEVVFPPSLASAWVLGRVGNMELGVTTFLADTSAYSSLEPGILTLAVAADNWVSDGGPSNASKNAFDTYQAIQDITLAERGKFFFDRDGKAVFWNRHHLLQGGTAVATFNDTMSGLRYSYASLEQTKNEVIVVCHPRTISPSASDVLWELGDAIIRVEAGQTREVYVKYADEGGKRIGGREVTVSDVAFESGAATVSVTANANGATLTFVNGGAQAAIVSQCIVRGRKITDSGQMEANATDAASVMNYGRRTLRLNLPSIPDLQQAQAIADFERDRRSTPFGLVDALDLVSHGQQGGAHHAQQLARSIGDQITVTETQSGHSGDYLILGESHSLSQSGTLWKTTWQLEPVPARLPWKLDVEGRSRLDSQTRLTY